MATYTTTRTATGVLARGGIDLVAVHAQYELTAALTTSDTIEMLKIPAGATVIKWTLAVDDLDSHSTPTIALELGDSGDADRYIDSAKVTNLGQSATVRRNSNKILYTYSSADTISVSVAANPATGASSGTINLVVWYSMNNVGA